MKTKAERDILQEYRDAGAEGRLDIMLANYSTFPKLIRKLPVSVKQIIDFFGEQTFNVCEIGKTQKNAHDKELKRLKAAKIFIDSRLKTY